MSAYYLLWIMMDNFKPLTRRSRKIYEKVKRELEVEE